MTIADATPNATIYYTTDGTTPTTSSLQFSDPLPVNGAATIRAFAVASGYSNSAVATASYSAATTTSTTLASSVNLVDFGTTVTFTAAVTATSAGTPTGTVSFTIDSGAAIVEPLDATGHASYSTNALAIGQHVITATYSGDTNYAGSSASSLTVTVSNGALQFVPVTPCRVADTRNPPGPFGGPEPAAGSTTTFNIPQSACNIPNTAAAYSLNVTVVPSGPLNYLTLWPSGQAQPNASTLNSDGRVKANAAIVPAGTDGGVSVFVSDPTQVILDIDGYFIPAGTASALAFYPVTPCRIADTRGSSGPLGGPSLAAASSRSFPVQSSTCGLPATAQAYSLNVTAIPHSTLNYLTTWPTGEAQPNVSTLNSSTGAVTANAAIVPAGSSGAVSVFVSDAADVILDVNGYFAPPGTGGLSLYTAAPCRVIDTRPNAFNGTIVVNVAGSPCAAPWAAQAYVLNATVVPDGALNYLTLWPYGGSQPNVSTLNADDAAISSNMAIVPTTNGYVEAFADGTTNLILDFSGYFAP